MPREALIEALRIDDAFRTVFAAPDHPALELTPADAERLPRMHLQAAAAFAMIEETWPLMALRQELPAQLSERPVPLPRPHVEGRRTWAICRGSDGQRVLPMTPPHAALIRLLRTHPLGEALSILETRGPAGAVAADVQRWLADGLRFGFWTALTPSTPTSTPTTSS